MVYYGIVEYIRSTFGQKKEEKEKNNILVIGYGWGGKAFCDTIDHSKYNIYTVTANPFFLNQPKLVETAVTSTNPAIMEIKAGTSHSIGKCTAIIPSKKEAEFLKEDQKTSFKMPYDYLVLAVGSIPNTFGIPGADTCMFLKTFGDANLLRSELQKKDPVSIIGAGPTGIELALALAKKNTPVQILEAAPSILPGFTDATKDAILDELKQHKVGIHLNTAVSAIGPNLITAKSGQTFNRGLAVWASGVKPNPLIHFLTKDRYLTTDGHFRVADTSNIYAIGDIVGERGPPTAQNARSQGIFLADHFNRGLPADGPTYTYKERGRIVHGADDIYIDYGGMSHKAPKFFGFLVDWVMK